MTNLRSILLGLLLVLTGARVDAALFGGEKKDFDLASKSFDTRMWSRAEKEFASFIKDHPKSEKITEAVLFQAQALYGQEKYVEVISLLASHEVRAGKSADQFLYWTAQAQFQGGNHRAATVTFGKLAREHPFSAWRLEAAVGEAASLAELGEWAQVTNLLRKTDGAFRMAASVPADKGSEMAARGFLLLGKAQLSLKNYIDAQVALKKAATGATNGLEWQRRLLLSRAYADNHQNEDAARESIGLIAAAETLKKSELIAESVVFRANLLEKLGQSDEAIATLQRNLTNAPPARQREALTRIITLELANNHLDAATQFLEQYLAQTNAPAADLAWLTLGEVNLKRHVASLNLPATNGVPTNYLALATNCFQRVIALIPPGGHVGKAQLNLGWCYWLEKRFAASASAFEAATKRLPVSEDLAVATFKLADALFMLTNYSGALQNYQEALQLATNWPSVNAALSAPASYQALRASLELTNASGAEMAMRGILAADAAGGSADGALLLVAQAYVDASQPAAAQRMFAEFVTRFPNSQLRPEAELLVARMREEQGDWTSAASAYELWVTRFPTNVLRAQVEFQRALSAARSGSETNALQMFTNFVAQFPTNTQAAQAQWWVADYFYQREVYAEAELNFKQVFQNWPSSELAYEARMMAGRAAVGKSAFDGAVEHFASLTEDVNCPPDLRAQALFAYGGTLMRMRSVPTEAETNKVKFLEQAMTVFSVIVRENPTNELTALAWGEVGNCCLQLAATDVSYYSAASNAYQMSFNIPSASVATRSQSKVGLAIVLEKEAQLLTNGGQAELLKAARELDLDVYFGRNLKDGETADVHWRRKAGSDAAKLSESLGEWEQAIKVYRDMLREGLLSADALDKKIANAEKQKQNGNGKKI